MSRNFELLKRAEREQELLGVSAPVVVPVPTNGRRRLPNDESAIREEALKLVQRVFLLPSAEGRRAVVFCDVDAGKGSSWVSARAAEALAGQVEGSVCLVDANLRSPRLHKHFGVSSDRGLSDALLDTGPIRNFARRLLGANLWLVVCGSGAADSLAVLKPDRLQSRLAELRAEFDYVLIDAPPVRLYTDALLVGQSTDGVVLVVEANSTRREAAHRAKMILEAANVKLLGAVLNNRTFPIPESIYRRL